MFQVMISPRLERICQQQDFRLAEELARKLQASGYALKEAARHGDRRMTSEVGHACICRNQEVGTASDEEVEIGHGFIHCFDQPHA